MVLSTYNSIDSLNARPEHASRGIGHEQAAMEFSVPWDGNVSETPPFVDSILTGKTFTPYLTIDASPQIHHGAPREYQPTEALLRLPTMPPEPLIRPG